MTDELRSSIGIILVVVVPLVCFLFRRHLGRLYQPLHTRLATAARRIVVRISPRWVVWNWSSGSIGKCPKCGMVVEYSAVRSGATAFICRACGENGEWIPDAPTEH